MSIRYQLKKFIAPMMRPGYRGRGSIIMLHRIVPESDKPRIHNTVNEITPKKLADLIEYYRNEKIEIIGIEELKPYLEKKSKNRFVVFTFDDGFKDNLTEALPIFEHYEAPFTVYVTTGFPDRSIIIWWYVLEQILLIENAISIKWGESYHNYTADSISKKEVVFNEIRRIIIDTPYKQQKEFLKEAFHRHIDDPFQKTKELALSWEELLRLSASEYVTIGAHTLNHPALNQLNESEVIAEALESKKLLENKLDFEVKHFSYPFGSKMEVNEREFDILSKLGFKTCVTTRVGNIFKAHLNHMACLPRIPIQPTTSFDYLQGYNTGELAFLRGSKKRVVTT